MSQPHSMLRWALRYRELGYHPVPCPPREKFPSIPWKPFQATAPTEAQIREWWTKTPDANIALVLGRGVMAVDLDGGDAAEALLREAAVELPQDAPRSRTGGGYHVLLSCDRPVGDRVALLSTNGGKPQVDIRGIGVIVAPPSIHPSGATYQWIVPPSAEKQPPAAPSSLLALMAERPKGASAESPHGDDWIGASLRGVGEGARNDTCARLAGFFLGKGLDPAVVTTLLQTGFAGRCTPPFPDAEVAAVVRSIAARDAVNGVEISEAPEHIASVINRVMNEVDAGGAKVVSTPFSELTDYLDGGFLGGQLVYIGARPGVGKTALAMEIARAAAGQGRAVLIVSREMTNLALGRRLLSQDARVLASGIKKGDLSPEGWQALSASASRLTVSPMWLTDRVMTLAQINAVLSTQPVELLIVDYLQLMRAPIEIRERRHQVEYVSHGLKTLALQYQIPVVCLSSLSRPTQLRGDGEEPRPTMASLRESGELEHDADIILLLHRQRGSLVATCFVEKNRDGRIGRVNLIFRGEYVAFEQDPDQQREN